jgi:transposase-like protein
MAAPIISCPLCRSKDIEMLANIPAIVLFKCRKCATAFTITPTAPIVPS